HVWYIFRIREIDMPSIVVTVAQSSDFLSYPLPILETPLSKYLSSGTADTMLHRYIDLNLKSYLAANALEGGSFFDPNGPFLPLIKALPLQSLFFHAAVSSVKPSDSFFQVLASSVNAQSLLSGTS